MSLSERARQCLGFAREAREAARNASPPLREDYLELAAQWTKVANEVAASAAEIETESAAMSVSYLFILHIDGNVAEPLEQHSFNEAEELAAAHDLAADFDID